MSNVWHWHANNNVLTRKLLPATLESERNELKHFSVYNFKCINEKFMFSKDSLWYVYISEEIDCFMILNRNIIYSNILS